MASTVQTTIAIPKHRQPRNTWPNNNNHMKASAGLFEIHGVATIADYKCNGIVPLP